MRIDKKGFYTLEEDIVDIFRKHGLEVMKEEVTKNIWKITAKQIPDTYYKTRMKKDIDISGKRLDKKYKEIMRALHS